MPRRKMEELVAEKAGRVIDVPTRWTWRGTMQMVERQRGHRAVHCPVHGVPYYVLSPGLVCLVGECEQTWP